MFSFILYNQLLNLIYFSLKSLSKFILPFPVCITAHMEGPPSLRGRLFLYAYTGLSALCIYAYLRPEVI